MSNKTFMTNDNNIIFIICIQYKNTTEARGILKATLHTFLHHIHYYVNTTGQKIMSLVAVTLYLFNPACYCYVKEQYVKAF